MGQNHPQLRTAKGEDEKEQGTTPPEAWEELQDHVTFSGSPGEDWAGPGCSGTLSPIS